MTIAIIPAAGSGTRMKELGKNYAKTVLPYEGKPIIIHIIESLVKSIEPTEIRVAVASGEHYMQLHEVIRAYGYSKLVNFWYVKDVGRQGPAKSIISALPDGDQELYVHLSDFTTLNNAVDIPVDSIAAFRVDDQHRWCMVSEDGSTYYDKPKQRVPTDLAVAGLYRFSSSELLRKCAELSEASGDGEFQISELLREYTKVRALSVSEVRLEDVKDFGTIEEFIQNRGISKTRSFNKITVDGNFVTKTSISNPKKLSAERIWYNSVPKEIAQYTPRVYDCSNNGYTMDLVQSTNLRELYLYLDRSEDTWREVFGAVSGFINECKKYASEWETTRFWESVFAKNASRVAGFEPALREEAMVFLDELNSEIRNSRFYNESTIYHGDLHFANMFYCFHYKQLRVIDPNGTIDGHWFYDLAKLNHSVNGKYDWIDAELYNGLGFMDRGVDGVHVAFDELISEFITNNRERRLLRRLTASLFLTMIPLHDHSPKNQDLFLQEWRRLR